MVTPIFIVLACLLSGCLALFFPEGSHNHPSWSSGFESPTRIVRKSTPSTSAQPIMSDLNSTDWSNQTNEECLAALNTSTIINPAGIAPCYNVLFFDPNSGNFISEVRLFQVISMEQPTLLSKVSSTGLLFEFPHAEITDSPGLNNITGLLSGGTMGRKRTNQINLVDTFYMNGTADISGKYLFF
jgi:hypothetical protein